MYPSIVLGPQDSGKTVFLCGIYRYVKHIKPVKHIEDEPDLLDGIKGMNKEEWPRTTETIKTYNFNVGGNKSIVGTDTPGQEFKNWTNEILNTTRKGIIRKLMNRYREKTRIIGKIAASILGSIFLIGVVIMHLHPVFIIISIPLIVVPFFINSESIKNWKNIGIKTEEEKKIEDFHRNLKSSKVWMIIVPADIRTKTPPYRETFEELCNRYKSLLEKFKPKKVSVIITKADIFQHKYDKKTLYDKTYDDLENFIKEPLEENYKKFEYNVVTEEKSGVLYPKKFPEGFKAEGVKEVIEWLRE